MSARVTTLTPKEEKTLAVGIPPTARDRTFTGLLERWKRIIEEVETGYRLTVDDYTNDLTIREIIARIVENADSKLKQKIESILEPLDQRFEGATFVATRPAFPGALARNPQAWWYARWPSKLVGELREDAKTWGVLSR